jgi:hypothetical protein
MFDAMVTYARISFFEFCFCDVYQFHVARFGRRLLVRVLANHQEFYIK